MDEAFWKRLTRQLAEIRRKQKILGGLALGLGFVAVLSLAFARGYFNHTGNVQWPWLALAAGCAALGILLRVYADRS
jgi:hypothetical protein